jgi:hypothetical protein
MRLTPNKLFPIFYALLLLVGGWLGYRLASMPHFDSVKLLAVFGIAYQLLGIVVLSETISSSARLKAFVVDWLAGVLLWGSTIVPMAAGFTALALFVCELAQFVTAGTFPSAVVVSKSSLGFMFYSSIPGIFVDEFVFGRNARSERDREHRSRFFGAFLVFTGTAVQLISAVQDFLR